MGQAKHLLLKGLTIEQLSLGELQEVTGGSGCQCGSKQCEDTFNIHQSQSSLTVCMGSTYTS
jgi:hypothetical protein